MTWNCIAVLPNIRLDDPVEGGRIAMASALDSRVAAAVKQHQSLGDFLSRFYDTHNNRIIPSVILWDDSTKPYVPAFDALCSFRDVVAVSYVLLARAGGLIAGSLPPTQWMDSFSIFPWMLTRDHKDIVCQTPAVHGLHNIKSFRGQTSPELVDRSLSARDLDRPLFDDLLQQWKEVYLDGADTHAHVALFRALNMAFRAGAIPGGVDATTYDYGRSLALWVSAFEILAHPGGSGKADLLKVYDLLEMVPYELRKVSDAVHAAYHNRNKQPASTRNLACWLYGEIYKARNDFLHGNPLPPDRLLIKASGRHLLSYAPPLYRVALSAALGVKWTRPRPPTTDAEAIGQWISDQIDFLDPQRSVEKALVTSLEPVPAEP